MVGEYLSKPDDKNIVFTAAYTFGYRLLVGELGRIIASSEATDKGFVYKPDKQLSGHNISVHKDICFGLGSVIPSYGFYSLLSVKRHCMTVSESLIRIIYLMIHKGHFRS